MLYGRIEAENAEGGSDVQKAYATIGKRLLGVLLAGALLLSLLPFGMAQETVIILTEKEFRFQ